jgi:hypothetical protein
MFDGCWVFLDLCKNEYIQLKNSFKKIASQFTSFQKEGQKEIEMYKKIVASMVLVVLLMVVTSIFSPVITTASSGTEINLPADLQQKVKTTVKIMNQETGESIYLNPELVSFSRDSNGQTKISYEVGIPSEVFSESQIGHNFSAFLFPSKVMAAQKVVDSCDSTSSGCARLTFNYTDFTTHMYANNVTAKWTKLDSQVTFVSGVFGLRAQADRYPSGSGNLTGESLATVTSPVSGTTYSMTPSFAGSGNNVFYNDAMGEYAVQFLNMRRGNTNWQFYTCVAVGGGALGWC